MLKTIVFDFEDACNKIVDLVFDLICWLREDVDAVTSSWWTNWGGLVLAKVVSYL